MTISQATNQSEWDAFLLSQPYRPFLQSWTMGEDVDGDVLAAYLDSRRRS